MMTYEEYTKLQNQYEEQMKEITEAYKNSPKLSSIVMKDDNGSETEINFRNLGKVSMIESFRKNSDGREAGSYIKMDAETGEIETGIHDIDNQQIKVTKINLNDLMKEMLEVIEKYTKEMIPVNA